MTFYYSSVVVKTGIVGDAQIGKTSLMVKYAEGDFDDEYIQTLGKMGIWLETRLIESMLGVNFMDKTILIRNTEITFSIWDLGGKCPFE